MNSIWDILHNRRESIGSDVRIDTNAREMWTLEGRQKGTVCKAAAAPTTPMSASLCNPEGDGRGGRRLEKEHQIW